MFQAVNHVFKFYRELYFSNSAEMHITLSVLQALQRELYLTYDSLPEKMSCSIWSYIYLQHWNKHQELHLSNLDRNAVEAAVINTLYNATWLKQLKIDWNHVAGTFEVWHT